MYRFLKAFLVLMKLLSPLFNILQNLKIFSSFRVKLFVCSEKGRNDGGKRAQVPGLQITTVAPKNSNNVTNTPFNKVHLLPKNLRFEHGGAKFASCPGRHFTSLRTCT